MEKVISMIKNKFNLLDKNTFENMKNTVMQQMLKIPIDLEKKNDTYWIHLLGYDYIFTKKRVQLYLKELKNYDLEKFIEKIHE